ncbi:MULTISPECIES: DUF397 domain-containing protein [Streptomyces]|uniref:DUF397 domain-containing protein n=1 Tax=Streptomyces scabiei (strain 87.22) TaxID=680198 RepID=C9ZD53_STRSW|nr:MULTISPECIES: DUF397 domain-containing protein [Streptomyces]MBP5860107.1 DUF397 domain-containing protein [Streptomyces sp. LBUM 1484]MBP5871044.1 DUF397 domain-containing protein [Streptomyces sp. LBUM 1485]MBP5908854.1 DUF397 domain-containing protein [Streptomyces sp. LBUM 1478]MBP5927561.1 DUF397 domain-containing protein [Streptomyces sp. LBUM 1479]KFG10792.1 hypothetical protein IQ61_00725 [Streptomyces scabiei]
MSTTELTWFKSSYSGSQGDDCVEVAVTGQAVCVRDSKDVTLPHFAVGRAGWSRFVGFVGHEGPQGHRGHRQADLTA